MKRKAYSTIEKQLEANKRYLEKNEEARNKKRRNTYKSLGKKFILEYAENEELKEYELYINERKKTLQK